jgi:hypothetical protein
MSERLVSHCFGYKLALVRHVPPDCRPRYTLEEWKTRLRGSAVVFGDEFSMAGRIAKSVGGSPCIKSYQRGYNWALQSRLRSQPEARKGWQQINFDRESLDQ